ncbi:MAG: hypothetical protein KC944_19640, partial [Candidatus Omnitrophica bacterium]|nr:hypothetical protein [Candidatus Omnitrophota bacterium]
WILIGLFAIGVLGTILAPDVFFTLLPRFLDPFGDHPPYSEIRLVVEPEGATVDFGENLKVTVQAEGRIPENVTLVLRNSEGEEISESPMFNEGEGAFFQTIENVEQDLQYFARVKRGRSHRYPLTVNKTPKILDVIAAYEYPKYTRKKPETTLLSDPLLKGYEKTQVTLTVSSNRPLGGGSIEVNGEKLSMNPSESEKASAKFLLLEPGEFEFTIEDEEGNQSQPPYRGRIEITPDEKPEIVIAEPGMDSFTVPDSKVGIVIDAFDDLGLTEVALFRSHNESQDDKKILYSGDGDHAQVSVAERLDLADLGVKPGDVIDYYATATDSHPDQPQTVTSDSFRLVIISFEEYKEFMQSQMTAEDLKKKYDQYLDELNQLAEAQEELKQKTEALEEMASKNSGLSPEEQKELDEAQKAQRGLQEWAEDLAKAMQEEAEKEAIFDIEKDYKESLKEFAESMATAMEKMSEAQTAMRQASEENQGESPDEQKQSPAPSLGLAASKQKEALENLQQNIEEYQKQISEPGEDLEKVANVISDTEKFKYLYLLQKGLERHIRYYKDMEKPSLEDQIRLKELSDQQKEVREALNQLKNEMREHADELDRLAEEQDLGKEG